MTKTDMSTTTRSLTILRVLGVGVALAALALVLAIALAPRPADAASKYKVVTKTFSSEQPIWIPPAGTQGVAAPYPSEKNVSGFRRGKIRDVNLTLKNFTHGRPRDVDVMLEHKGVNRTVMSDAGAGIFANNAVNNITLKLDDEAAGSLPNFGQLTGGAFRPANFQPTDNFPQPAPPPSGQIALSGFDGKNPNGAWRMWVVDDANDHYGVFAGGWSITIKARVRR